MPEAGIEIRFYGGKLIITNHALNQFKESWGRVRKEELPKKPVEVLEKLLTESELWEMPPKYRVGRLHEDRVWNAEYRETKEWRFTIVPGRRSMDGDKKFLITVEPKKVP